VSHKPGVRLPLLSARPAVTPATLKRAATSFAAWWTEAQWVWTVCLRLLPDSVALRFEPGPFCAWVQHANHSATKPPHYAMLYAQNGDCIVAIESLTSRHPMYIKFGPGSPPLQEMVFCWFPAHWIALSIYSMQATCLGIYVLYDKLTDGKV